MTKVQVVEVVGIISVVLSLLFVAFQIQQTNQIALVSTEIEIRNNYSELNEAMFSDPALALLMERASEPDYEPRPGEHIQLRSLGWRFMNVWLATEIAYTNDMLPEGSFNIAIEDIGAVMQSMPYMKHVFREILLNYPGWEKTRVVLAINQHLESEDEG